MERGTARCYLISSHFFSERCEQLDLPRFNMGCYRAGRAENISGTGLANADPFTRFGNHFLFGGVIQQSHRVHIALEKETFTDQSLGIGQFHIPKRGGSRVSMPIVPVEAINSRRSPIRPQVWV